MNKYVLANKIRATLLTTNSKKPKLSGHLIRRTKVVFEEKGLGTWVNECLSP